MLPLVCDPELLASLRAAGVDAWPAWDADGDSDALVMVEADRENLNRLKQWLARCPDVAQT